MDLKQHYLFLEQMYLQAPIVKALYPETTIGLGHGESVIQFPVRQDLFHAGGSLHGSVYFRMLDDAAYFAASSLEFTFLLLTADFQLRFLRPVTEGMLKAEGRLIEGGPDTSFYTAKAELFTADGKIAATAKGRFMRSKKRLSDIIIP